MVRKSVPMTSLAVKTAGGVNRLQPRVHPNGALAFAGILLAVSFSTEVAHAAGEGCGLAGMLSPGARAICEAAVSASRSQRAPYDRGDEARGDAYADDRGQGPQDTDGVSFAPPPPIPGLHRYAIANGGLYVDLPGDYPQGYGPSWALNATAPQAIIMDRYNRMTRGPQGTETLDVRIIDDQGRAVLEFARRGSTPCLADIVGLPQVITEAPKQFRLANFRYANNQGPQCQRRLGSTAPWQGRLTLSGDPDGNLRVSLVLNLAFDSRTPWFEFTARDLPFDNLMTPQMAVADVEKKKQAVLAQAARVREAAAARAEAEARIRSLPLAGPIYTRQLAGYVRTDSLGWASNQLDAGSVRNVRIYAGSVKSGNFVLRGEYTYNGGASGWVVAAFTRGKFACIQFWDTMVGCRTLRKPGEGSVILSSIIGSVVESGTSGSGASGAKQGWDENARFNMWHEQQVRDGYREW